MANTRSGKNSSGCGALIVGLILLGVVAAIIGGIARGLTNLSIWMQYGSAGLPDPLNRSPAYPLAWGLFFGSVAFIGLAVAGAVYEQSRRKWFNVYVAGLQRPAGIRGGGGGE